MDASQPFAASPLADAGLNLHAVFNLADLPAGLRQSLADAGPGWNGYRQLILIGHGGRRLWQAVQAAHPPGPDPIDTFTVQTLQDWFARHYPSARYTFLYPAPDSAPGVGLQSLGELAGWHQPGPFMLGVRADWGSWFAYRAVILADTAFAPTPAYAAPPPCASCAGRPCVAACPGGAMATGQFSLTACVAYRKAKDSACKATCLARLACPVGAEHRYDAAQLAHTYGISMAAIEAWY